MAGSGGEAHYGQRRELSGDWVRPSQREWCQTHVVHQASRRIADEGTLGRERQLGSALRWRK